jgi:RNA-directed DNA polymerase
VQAYRLNAEQMERVDDQRRLHQAWHTVRRHAGAAGIDQMTVDDFAQREEELLDLLHAKLQAGTYRFKAARRVEIPKPGSTQKRHLGIPVVMDRIVSHSLPSVREERFEPEFTTSNFGFRRGKSQHPLPYRDLPILFLSAGRGDGGRR